MPASLLMGAPGDGCFDNLDCAEQWCLDDDRSIEYADDDAYEAAFGGAGSASCLEELVTPLCFIPSSEHGGVHGHPRGGLP